MKKETYKRGFTLIELLTVIAILGILASVIILSLNSSRSTGIDAKSKSQMSSVRSAAEAYSGLNGGYSTAGSCAAGMFIDVASGMAGATNLSNYPTGTTIDCGASPSAYSVAISLGSGAWCVDSKGNARNKTAAGVQYTALTGSATAAHLAAGATSCN